jgi:Tol biopolymer transport system component
MILPTQSGGSEVHIQTFPYNTRPPTIITTNGNPANATISFGGRVLAWDADSTNPVGRQVMVYSHGIISQLTNDPTATSINPSLSGNGSRIAFSSKGDLIGGTSAVGAQQVYYAKSVFVTLKQISQGQGTSDNATLSFNGKMAAFDSTSDPTTGADTGISQIWTYRGTDGFTQQLTSALGNSHKPIISPDGTVVAFESTADLAHGGADTGIPQIFAYDMTSGLFAQVTNDPAGCTQPTMHVVPWMHHDLRLSFVCGGRPQFHMLRNDLHFELDGFTACDTTREVAELNGNFLVMSTTCDLTNGGTVAGHQLFLWNLYKKQPISIDTHETWFQLPIGKAANIGALP